MDDEQGKLFFLGLGNGGFSGILMPCTSGGLGCLGGLGWMGAECWRACARATEDTGGLAPVPPNTPEGSRPCRSRG
jgi:hypothetical protein